MILTRQNLIYFGAALLVGAIFAFGISSLTYQPVPLQVTENPYTPTTPPTPAVTILAPQYVPGSYADANKNTTGDPYTPAPAPVVVTTAPLPTITAIPTAGGSERCKLNPVWNQTLQSTNQEVQNMFGMATVLPIAIIGVGILMIVLGAFGSADTYSVTSPFNTAQTEAAKEVAGAFWGSGTISIIITLGVMLVALYILAVVTGSISAAILNTGCTP
jgi:hypothetical protein